MSTTFDTLGAAPRAAASCAAASRAQYARLTAEHPVLADVACFRAAHVNYLTPRTLDIGRASTLCVGSLTSPFEATTPALVAAGAVDTYLLCRVLALPPQRKALLDSPRNPNRYDWGGGGMPVPGTCIC
ncbi:hypothetical protein GGR56DRAFT_674211 [Xylariaceae sp. FL0804]|nr:hypothetical protein GGR56DRAFT_674211 [Xylariaceae sp. FL0804]